jgi:RimJ/RimL family protein N-acetyltransferase
MQSAGAGPAIRLEPLTRAQSVELLRTGQLAGLPVSPGWPPTEALVAIGVALAATASGDAPFCWLIREAADGAVLGACTLAGPPSPEGEVEIGYQVVGPHRGCGIGTAAVRELLAVLAAERPDIRVVGARVAPDNAPSISLLRRLGFALVERSAGGLRFARPL